MASVLRTSLAGFNSSAFLVGLCKASPRRHNVAITQVAWITGRELRRDRPPRPKPFDWQHKKIGLWVYYTDPIYARFDDNTRIVVVDGMPGVGKDKFAKQLAEELEMKYIKPPNFDDVWINPYGFDLRTLNNKLPVDAQYSDVTTFLNDPNHRNVVAMQLSMLWMRSTQYIDALAHLLSTGQGLVLQRTPWTDAVFMHAMADCGYVSKKALEYHRDASTAVTQELLKPHLHIYLDAPVSTIKQKIKQRNLPHEVNSKALTDEYLNTLEKRYKEYLREMSRHGNLLIYDWTNEGDMGAVVEDIERLEFDITPEKKDLKFHDWKFDPDWEVKDRRHEFCMHKEELMMNMIVCRVDIPELFMSGEDDAILDRVMEEVDTEKYAPGYNPKYDEGLLFKTRNVIEDWFPRDKVTAQK